MEEKIRDVLAVHVKTERERRAKVLKEGRFCGNCRFKTEVYSR